MTWRFAYCQQCMCHTYVDSTTGICQHGGHKVLKSAYQKARDEYRRKNESSTDFYEVDDAEDN